MLTVPFLLENECKFALHLLDGVEEICGSGRGAALWTAGVKSYLQKMGQEPRWQYRPIYTDGAGMSEFMLDFVGWRDGKPGGAVLACECEWAHTKNSLLKAARVGEDFDKLLSFKSPLKLMIFDSSCQLDNQEKVIGTLNRYLADFQDHRAGETYIVVDMSGLRSAWMCRIETDGHELPYTLNEILRYGKQI